MASKWQYLLKKEMPEMLMRRKRRWKKIVKGAFLWGSVLLPCVVLLMLWSMHAEDAAHFTPDYEKMDLRTYTWKETLSPVDYQVLMCQTGMGRAAVDGLWETTSENRLSRQQTLQYLQDRFFTEADIRCESNTILTRQEEMVNMPNYTSDWRRCYPFIEEGDILITFCCHFFGWRNGHAGIVVDAEEGLVLEAKSLGSNSSVGSMHYWTRYPSVAVLRLKDTSKEKRTEIAEHAKEYYRDIPYNLGAGIVPEEEGTQCAHLVYTVYRDFGYDLDANRGRIVTPEDIFNSDQLELVQMFGMDPDGFGDMMQEGD